MLIPLLVRHYKSTASINLKAICVCDFDKPDEPKSIRRLRPGQADPGEEAPSRLPSEEVIQPVSEALKAGGAHRSLPEPSTQRNVPKVSSFPLDDEIDHHREGDGWFLTENLYVFASIWWVTSCDQLYLDYGTVDLVGEICMFLLVFGGLRHVISYTWTMERLIWWVTSCDQLYLDYGTVDLVGEICMFLLIFGDGWFLTENLYVFASIWWVTSCDQLYLDYGTVDLVGEICMFLLIFGDGWFLTENLYVFASIWWVTSCDQLYLDYGTVDLVGEICMFLLVFGGLRHVISYTWTMERLIWWGKFLLDNYETELKNSGKFDLPNYETDDEVLGSYDYIIVGAGSAGTVLANRLSENPHISVLLLEAGETANRVSEVPLAAGAMQFSKYNWKYVTEKQENFGLGIQDQLMSWPRGKGLGGSSVINTMIHTRGNKHDYDRWAAMGNPGWSYQDVLPYFDKLEAYNTQGYLSKQYLPYKSKLAHTFVATAVKLGYNCVDYNKMDRMGVSFMEVSLRNGRRCSGEKAFLRPAKVRNNLKILQKSIVTKILIDLKTTKAYGVEYLSNNRYLTVNGSKEIILSAGVFGSPKILMLSGIGPRDHLKEMEIPIVRNLPVGQKIYDHLGFWGAVFTSNKSMAVDISNVNKQKNLFDFVEKGTGPLTLPDGLETILFLKTKDAKYKESYPNLELYTIAGSLQSDGGIVYKEMLRFTDKVYNSLWKKLEGKDAWNIVPLLLHPKSYGFLRLRSKNPLESLQLYGSYLTDPYGDDLKTLIAGIREAQRIIKTPIFLKYGTQQVNTKLAGCEHFVYDTDSYWECAIRHISTSNHHQTTTCKMGPKSDPEAVVDNKLRVYGVRNLRVADTSIIPLSLSAHTNVPAFMVGEKASNLVLTDYYLANW
ncbi:hypothetical protein FQA39_LY15350 [Lamprigera yunnana]|nr:hypothetical protein FQA39_LY15350 [Lamprigera yunnana]